VPTRLRVSPFCDQRACQRAFWVGSSEICRRRGIEGFGGVQDLGDELDDGHKESLKEDIEHIKIE